MDSFQGNGTISLQKGTSNFPYRFQIAVATSSNKNDGAIPYKSSLCSFTVGCHPVGATAASTQIIVTKSQSSNHIITRLTWTTQINPGVYHLEYKIVASVNNSTVTPLKRQFDFARVYLKQRR